MPTATDFDPRQGSLLLTIGLAALAAYVGYYATGFSALSDYFMFTAEYAQNNLGIRLILQFLVGVGLYVVFAMLLYRRVISPAKGTATTAPANIIELVARLVILSVPAAALSYLLVIAALSAAKGTTVIWSAAALVSITAVIQIVMAIFSFIKVWPLRKNEVAQPTRWSTILLLLSAPAAAFTLYLWIWSDVIGATFFVGGVGIVLLFLICSLLILEMLFWLNAGIRGIIGWLIAAILVCQFIGGSSPEFEHSAVSIPDTKLSSPKELTETVFNRNVPSVATAFREWLEKRSAAGTALAQNKKYPVFIVAAQGGGQYAAYHTALSLARLYDNCPKLKDHVFAISGVSGGSFGAAMFSELLQRRGIPNSSCSNQLSDVGQLEAAVRHFFEFDLVTPVIATGLFFDMPALVIPQLRFMPDRARTLELAFNNAISYALGPSKEASSTMFYSSWRPDGVVPALFFNTTSANYGRPILVSQLYMTDKRSESLFLKALESAMKAVGNTQGPDAERSKLFQGMIVSGVRASEYSRPMYFNILEYRPDLQLPLSTAAVLSARFPYVTPPGILYPTDKYAAADATLRDTTSLQLIDGGFWDNSGIATANEIIKQLQTADETKELASKIEFHLISFGHSNAALQSQGARAAQSELVAPITTFEAVREARSFRQTDATAAGFHAVHGYQLFDYEFRAPLSWTLSARVRAEIEARSGGRAKPSVCCVLSMPEFLTPISPEMVLDVNPFKKYLKPDFSEAPEREGFKYIAPNARQFQAVIRAVQVTSRSDVSPSK